MAEEIVDLAGSRIEDPRYVDNVIFDKEGLNELLTHIKNYPIIDIDYVEEHDKDALNTDKKVWPIYTEGTPCIKVTYGDSNNTNGNLSKQDKQEIHDLQEVYRLLNGVQNIINKYNTIDEEYITLIKNLEEELNKILYNISLKYHNLLNADYENFIVYNTVINEQTGEVETTNDVLAEGLECWNLDRDTPSKMQHDKNADPPLDIWGGSLYSAFDKSFIDCLYHTAPNSQDNRLADGLKYKITYQINSFSNRIESWITDPTLIDNENAFYTTTYSIRENKKIINPLPSEGASEFYIIPLMPTITNTFDKTTFKEYVTPQGNDTVSKLDGFLAQVFPDSSADTMEIKQKKAQLRDSFNHYNDLLLNLEDILNTGGANNEGNIKALLYKYIGYLQESRWKRYEEIRKYLVSNNINTVQLQNGTEVNLKTITVSEYSTVSSSNYYSSNYYKVFQYVKENYIEQDKQNILNRIQSKINGCVKNKYTAVSSNETYDSTKEYYVFNEDTKRYEKVDIQSFESGITYYTLNENNYPATYGYKYVKVGSNITWDSNYDTVSKDSTDNQKSGTFRITINGHTFEVPIKGFGTKASNEPITIKTSNTKPIEITASGSTESGGNTVYNSITLTASDGNGTINLNGTTNISGNTILGTSSGARNLLPSQNNSGTIGSSSYKWNTIYATNIGASDTRVSDGYFGTITTNKITNNDGIIQVGNSTSDAQLIPTSTNNSSALGTDANPWDSARITSGKFDTISIWNGVNSNPRSYVDLSAYINSQVTYGDGHPLKVTNKVDGVKTTINGVTTNGFNASGTIAGDDSASISTAGGIYAAKNIWATRVFNAVFNDYAECRSTISLTPGHVVIDQDDGSLACSSKRLQPGAQVISDTYGHLMGQTENATTPIAVAGRVLVYTYQPRENYHAGMAVCSAPDGTVDIMSRAEICEYPDCIVGIVSEIPNYEIWGSDNVKVDGRIWIKVR